MCHAGNALSQLICLVLPLGLKSSQWAYILPFGLNGKYISETLARNTYTHNIHVLIWQYRKLVVRNLICSTCIRNNSNGE